jgi:prepilin-type N-terminal cleavage/methylation domain-containing protein
MPSHPLPRSPGSRAPLVLARGPAAGRPSGARGAAAGARGFTFIEILIVMGIISVLVGGVVIAIQIWADRGPKMESQNTVTATQQLIHAWKSKFDAFPPTDVKDLPKITGYGEPVKGNPNRSNMGIEALVQALGYPGFKSDHTWKDTQIGNTDEDSLDKAIVSSGIKELREILDAWQNPLVYINSVDYASSIDDGYTYVLGGTSEAFMAGDEVTAYPHKDEDGQFRNANTFQIFSMGPDGQPNTEDDIGNWQAK